MSEESGDVRARLHQVVDAATVLQRHGFDLAAMDVEGFAERASARLRHGTDHTVVALVGSTGSGKSSTLNAIAGQPIARTGVTRPTTSVTQAVTFGDSADGLLDLIGVTRRHHLGEGDPALSGLVLLDLPDFDSVTAGHRMEVDRLVALVDLMVWVTDPQKYADESLHAGYLRRLSSHAEVMQVVLNQADTLDPAGLAACLSDLTRLLRADGLDGVTPIASSTVTGEGLDELRGVLAAEVRAKQAAVERIHADIDVLAAGLQEVAGDAGSVALERLREHLVDDLAGAAGVDAVAALVAAQYRRDTALATGWPPLRWIRRFRRAPLSRMPTSVGNEVARAEVSRSLRRAANDAQERIGSGWGVAATTAIRGQVDTVAEALDMRISRNVQSLRTPARRWRPVSAVHRVLLWAALLGGLWLVGVAAAETFLLVDVADFVPRWRGIALPTALLVGGVGAGLLTALLARAAGRFGATRRARRATADLRVAVAAVADEQVIDVLRSLLADAELAGDLLADASRAR